VIEDQVQGRVVWQNENLDDLVLLRSDGNPTYMLAVVVDDHDMGVTHVIRGDDHLINAARQKHIYDAMGWRVPVMAHIPLIHGPDGSKLSSAMARSASSLSRARVSAGGAAQLPRPSRLEPWRSGNLLHRGDDTGVRPARHRAFGSAVRLRQARKHQRPLHPQLGRQGCWQLSKTCFSSIRTAHPSAPSSTTPRARSFWQPCRALRSAQKPLSS
jgi:hypothetical protein